MTFCRKDKNEANLIEDNDYEEELAANSTTATSAMTVDTLLSGVTVDQHTANLVVTKETPTPWFLDFVATKYIINNKSLLINICPETTTNVVRIA